MSPKVRGVRRRSDVGKGRGAPSGDSKNGRSDEKGSFSGSADIRKSDGNSPRHDDIVPEEAESSIAEEQDKQSPVKKTSVFGKNLKRSLGKIRRMLRMGQEEKKEAEGPDRVEETTSEASMVVGVGKARIRGIGQI